MEQNLNIDEFRIALIREAMEAGDYARGERLCLERMEERPKEQQRRTGQWEHLLYEVYQAWGRRDKQIGQARRLALLGDRDFYRTTKALLTEDGRWEAEYPGFLAELKSQWSPYAYMDILAEENERTLLMEEVRIYQDAVFQYGAVLVPQYGGEVCRLCAGAIRQAAGQINNRRDYQRLCGQLRSLAGFGGTGEAQALIRELRQAYPRRKALWEELEQAEREIGKGAKRS